MERGRWAVLGDGSESGVSLWERRARLYVLKSWASGGGGAAAAARSQLFQVFRVPLRTSHTCVHVRATPDATMFEAERERAPGELGGRDESRNRRISRGSTLHRRRYDVYTRRHECSAASCFRWRTVGGLRSRRATGDDGVDDTSTSSDPATGKSKIKIKIIYKPFAGFLEIFARFAYWATVKSGDLSHRTLLSITQEIKNIRVNLIRSSVRSLICRSNLLSIWLRSCRATRDSVDDTSTFAWSSNRKIKNKK